MTTQQEQPQTETQPEQPTSPEQPTEQQQPRAEAGKSLAERTAHLEGSVGDIPRQLDTQNRSIEGLRAEMLQAISELRKDFNSFKYTVFVLMLLSWVSLMGAIFFT